MPPSCALPVLRAVRDGAYAEAPYADAVRDCVLLGGCSASRAAVCGGLVAAARGLDTIPVAWILKVHEIGALLDDCERLLSQPAAREPEAARCAAPLSLRRPEATRCGPPRRRPETATCGWFR